MKKYLWLALCWPMLCTAQPPNKADFAFGYTLEVDGDGAIYSVDLPEEVYRGLTRADRGDLRVFNSQGMAVPHHLKRAGQAQKQDVPDVNLPLFPLYADAGAPPAANGYDVKITTNEQGAIIDINYGSQSTQTRKLNAYLFDTSQLEQAPNALAVHWPPEQGDFVATVHLEVSDDLATWQTLVSRATLSSLHYGGHSLIQQNIELPLKDYKYLRMRWEGDPVFALTQVQARFPETYQQQERRWSEFSVTQTDTEQHYYYFDTQAVLPADRLNVSLPQRNMLTRVLVESAQSRDGPWYHRYNGLLYDLQYAGSRLKSPDVHFAVTADRYWRMQYLDDESTQAGAPQLVLGWVPEQLFFIAQGEAPFLLAYGSGRVTSTHTALPQLLGVEEVKQQQLVKAAQLGSRIELGDASRLEPPRPPADWKRYSLWGVLVLGVILLAWMALRLYREMEGKSD